jgi:hypothetical protein
LFNAVKTNLISLQAGIMEEMLEETLEMDEEDEIEEEADAEVDKVLFELTDGKLGLAGAAGTDLPVHLSSFVFLLTSDEGGRHYRTSWTKKRRRELWNNTDNS